MSTVPPGQTPAGGADENVIRPTNAKDPILALILAFFLGGISYFVLGQWQKGIAAVAVWLCGLVFAIVTCGIGSILFLPLSITIVIDAYMQAKCLRDGHAIRQWTFFSKHC